MLTTKPDEQSKYQTSFDARDTEATTASSSIAGAGSGDFHTYRKLKRKEMERLSQLEREAKEVSCNNFSTGFVIYFHRNKKRRYLKGKDWREFKRKKKKL
jgi:hypothetical protein